MEKNYRTIIECDCYSHLVTLDSDDVNGNLMMYLQIWHSAPKNSNFWTRLKVAFNILFKGQSLHSDVVLNKEELKKMNNFIYQWTKEDDSINRTKSKNIKNLKVTENNTIISKENSKVSNKLKGSINS